MDVTIDTVTNHAPTWRNDPYMDAFTDIFLKVYTGF